LWPLGSGVVTVDCPMLLDGITCTFVGCVISAAAASHLFPSSLSSASMRYARSSFDTPFHLVQ
jgi:hypothetical protein